MMSLALHVSNEQPPSMWVEGMSCPSSVDGSGLSLVDTVKRTSEGSSRQDENPMQSCQIGFDCHDVDANERNFPFVKSSPIWGHVESMEVFQVMPQHPHFHHLYIVEEELCEGLALGEMVTFANLAARTLKLQFSDPRTIIDRSLETLSKLEIDGFDVKSIRCRLNELLLIKCKQEQLLEEKKEAKMKIMEIGLEKSQIDEDIHKLCKMMIELNWQLALATWVKEENEDEIAALQSKLEAIYRDIQITQHEFEKKTAAP